MGSEPRPSDLAGWWPLVTRGEQLRGVEGPVASRAVVGSRAGMRVKTIVWGMFAVTENVDTSRR